MMTEDILIIGGGLAGAAAALFLRDLGKNSVIIEAQPRIGGRALSRNWGEAVDYGGGWLRADHHLMRALCQRLDIPLIPRAPLIAHSHFRDGRHSPLPADDMDAYHRGMAQVLRDAAQMQDPENTIHSQSMQDYFQYRGLPDSVQREIMAWWTISGSGAPDQIGANELLTPKLAKGLLNKLDELAFTVAGGMGAVVQAAVTASMAKVILGDPVCHVAMAAQEVRVTLGSGAVIAGRQAIVALPINVMGQITFSPALNGPQQAILRHGHAGRAIKLLIRAKGPRPGHLATGHSGGLRWIYADRVLATGETLLIGFALQDEMVAPNAASIATALAAAFPDAELIDFDWHDWCDDPFARGTWVSPRLDSLPDYAPDHWGPRGPLAFAGSDLYSAEQGWFEGAVLTARAAMDALQGDKNEKR